MRNRSQKVISVFLLLLSIWLLWFIAWTYFDFGMLPCVFHMVTGYYCPGCGATRATLALSHLDIAGAFRLNALFTLSLPLIAYYLAKTCYLYIRRGIPMPAGKHDMAFVLAYGALALVFAVIRNMPQFSFLAPI